MPPLELPLELPLEPLLAGAVPGPAPGDQGLLRGGSSRPCWCWPQTRRTTRRCRRSAPWGTTAARRSRRCPAFPTAPFQNCSCLKASLLHSPPASEEDAAAPPEDHSVSSHAPPPVQNHHLLLVYLDPGMKKFTVHCRIVRRREQGASFILAHSRSAKRLHTGAQNLRTSAKNLRTGAQNLRTGAQHVETFP